MAVAIATAAAADARCSVSVLENLGQACASSFPSESHLFSDIRDQRLGMALVGRGVEMQTDILSDFWRSQIAEKQIFHIALERRKLNIQSTSGSPSITQGLLKLHSQCLREGASHSILETSAAGVVSGRGEHKAGSRADLSLSALWLPS